MYERLNSDILQSDYLGLRLSSARSESLSVETLIQRPVVALY